MKLTANLDCDRFEYAERCARNLADGEPQLVFDIGAGSGLLRAAMESLGHRYVGFDLNPGHPEVRSWNLEDPPNVSEQASVVLMLEVVEHLWNPGRCLENVSAALQPGGHLVLTTPNPLWSRGRFDLLIRHEMACFTRDDLEVNHHVFTGWPHVIERLLCVSGFEIVEYVTLDSHLPWPNRPISPSYPGRIVKHGLSRLIEAADRGAKGMGYGVLARKKQASTRVAGS